MLVVRGKGEEGDEEKDRLCRLLSLSDKESDGTHQKFPALSLTNVLTLGPGLRVQPSRLHLPPSLPTSLRTAMIHIHILTAYGLCVEVARASSSLPSLAPF